MAPTSLDYFTTNQSWVPYSAFELVYEGYILLETVDRYYDFYIELDEPFVHTGGNLALMHHRVHHGTSNSFPFNNWHITGTPGVARTIRAWQFNVANFTPTAYPNGNVSNFHPNIKLFINSTNTGGVVGEVSYDGDLLEGVEIAIKGTNIRTTTDENGGFYIGYIPVDDIVLEARKHGFYPHESNPITIISGDTVTYDIAMTKRPVVSVSGTVLSSDTGLGIAGATISLKGYSDYTGITTNASGVFTITGVVSNETYTLTISRQGYQIHIDEEIVVAGINLTLDDIMLIERTNRPRNVAAEDQGNQVVISWETPIIGEQLVISHAINVTFDNGIGTVSTPSEWEVAHRFSSTQLTALGVVGGYLTQVSFVPYLSSRQGLELPEYEIRIYTGGSGSPLNPGTMVYTQPVLSYYFDEWNTYELTTHQPIPVSGELWIAIRIQQHSIGTPMGVDRGPRADGYGNLITSSTGWTTLHAMASMNNNFAIRGMIEGAPWSRSITQLPMGSFEDIHAGLPVELTRSQEGFITLGTKSPSEINEPIHVDNRESNVRAIEGFRVSRANIEDLDDDSLWTTVAPLITGNTFTDTSWATQPQGAYKYVVKTVYTNDNLSEPSFSNIVDVDMHAVVTINITTADNGSASGAVVSLRNNNENRDHVYTQTATSNTIVFPAVWLGNYTLTISRVGYGLYTNDDLDILTLTASHTTHLYIRQILLEEGFDLGFIPLTWLNIDQNNDGNSWEIHHGFSLHNAWPVSPPFMAVSRSWVGVDPGIHADNWLITPRLDIPENTTATLTYFIRTGDSGGVFRDYYELRISTTGTQTGSEMGNIVGDFELIHRERPIPRWIQKSIDLSEYAGQSIYIAFRHKDSEQEYIALDNVVVCIVFDQDKDPLSVVLSNFTSNIINTDNQLGVSLSWRTSTENNLLGFEVLRNTEDNRNTATAISHLISGTNTSTIRDYSFNDFDVSAGNSYYYWLAMRSNDGVTHFSGSISVDIDFIETPPLPTETIISSAFPNPMRAGNTANFNVEVKENEVARLQIFNIRGQLVYEINDIQQGRSTVSWEGRDRNNVEVASGVYFYRFTSQSAHTVQRMVILK